MESMKAVALAAKARSLADFQKAVKTFKVRCERFQRRQISNRINQAQLEDDMIVAKHLTTLYSNMLEHNLCRFAIDPNMVNLNQLSKNLSCLTSNMLQHNLLAPL